MPKPPAITTIEGTQFYSRTLAEHLETLYHKECVKSGMFSFTHFHYSALRTAEYKKVAEDHKVRVLNLPKIFEIRWTAFTFQLLRKVLVS